MLIRDSTSRKRGSLRLKLTPVSGSLDRDRRGLLGAFQANGLTDNHKVQILGAQ